MTLRPLVLAGTVILPLFTAACAYDPYTGTYVPCCTYPAYGYPYYPPPGPGAPPQAAPGRLEPPPPPGPPPGYGQPSYGPQSYQQPEPAAGGHMAQKFAAANTTGDGRLTLSQAQAARWKIVARNFSAIDAGGKGYVTLDDVHAWMASRRAQPPTG